MSERKKPKDHENRFGAITGRAGWVARQPVLWVTATALMATAQDPQIRRAAGRGAACYLIGAAVGNLPKPLFNRAQPRHKKPKSPQVIRGSFPSGHAAAELAFVFGASQEAPSLFPPLALTALLAHWDLIRQGRHYLSDTLVGGTMGLLVALAAGRVRPPAPLA